MLFRRYSLPFPRTHLLVLSRAISCIVAPKYNQPTVHLVRLLSNRLLTSGSASRSLVVWGVPDKVRDREMSQWGVTAVAYHLEYFRKSKWTQLPFTLPASISELKLSSIEQLSPKFPALLSNSSDVWSAITPFSPLIQLTYPTLNEAHLRLSFRFPPQHHSRCAVSITNKDLSTENLAFHGQMPLYRGGDQGSTADAAVASTPHR